MKKRNLLASVLVISLCGAVQVNATSKIKLDVKTYSTGYIQKSMKTVTADEKTDYCALSTMTNFINVVGLNYCTIRNQNERYVLEANAPADRGDAGVNCSMICFSSKSIKVK